MLIILCRDNFLGQELLLFKLINECIPGICLRGTSTHLVRHYLSINLSIIWPIYSQDAEYLGVPLCFSMSVRKNNDGSVPHLGTFSCSDIESVT